MEPPNPSGICACGCGEKTTIAKNSDRRTGAVKGEHLKYAFGHQSRHAASLAGGYGKHGHGRYKSSHGYMYVKWDTLTQDERDRFAPMMTRFCAFKAVSEHRLVMARSLGRPLATAENVHHKNGKRDDNRIENLELWVSAQPSRQRVGDLCPWCEGTGLIAV